VLLPYHALLIHVFTQLVGHPAVPKHPEVGLPPLAWHAFLLSLCTLGCAGPVLVDFETARTFPLDNLLSFEFFPDFFDGFLFPPLSRDPTRSLFRAPSLLFFKSPFYHLIRWILAPFLPTRFFPPFRRSYPASPPLIFVFARRRSGSSNLAVTVYLRRHCVSLFFHSSFRFSHSLPCAPLVRFLRLPSFHRRKLGLTFLFTRMSTQSSVPCALNRLFAPLFLAPSIFQSPLPPAVNFAL